MRTRKPDNAYIIEALLEYLVSLLVAGSFLAALLKSIGASDAVTGIISSILSIVCISRLFSGALASRFRRPRRAYLAVMLINQLMFVSLYLIPFVPFSSGVKTAIFFAVMLIAEVLLSVVMPSKYQWLMSYIDVRSRGKFTARKEIISLIGGMIFSFVMGWISDTMRESGHEKTGFAICAFTLLAIMLIYRVNLKTGIPDEEYDTGKSASALESIRMLRDDRHVRLLIVADILHFAGMYASTPFYGTYIIGELGYSLTSVSVFGILYAVFRSLVAPFFGRFADKKGWLNCFSLCTVILILSFAVNTFTVPRIRWLYPVYYTLYGIAFGGYNMSYTNITYDYVPDTRFAALFGLRSAVGGCVGFVTSLLCSMIVSSVQASGNTLWGMNVYAQQILSGMSCAIYAILFIYQRSVLSRVKPAPHT